MTGKNINAILLSIIVSFSVIGAEDSQCAKNETKIDLHNEADDTDVYAIPLDSSVEDQDSELEEFEMHSH